MARLLDCQDELRRFALGLCDPDSTLRTLTKNRLYEPRVTGLVKDFLLTGYRFGHRRAGGGGYGAVDVDQHTGHVYTAACEIDWCTVWKHAVASLYLDVFGKHGAHLNEVKDERIEFKNAYDVQLRVHGDFVYVLWDGHLRLFTRDLVHQQSIETVTFETITVGPGEYQFAFTRREPTDTSSKTYFCNDVRCFVDDRMDSCTLVGDSQERIDSLCMLSNGALISAIRGDLSYKSQDGKFWGLIAAPRTTRSVRTAGSNCILLLSSFRKITECPIPRGLPLNCAVIVPAHDACWDVNRARLIYTPEAWRDQLCCLFSPTNTRIMNLPP